VAVNVISDMGEFAELPLTSYFYWQIMNNCRLALLCSRNRAKTSAACERFRTLAHLALWLVVQGWNAMPPSLASSAHSAALTPSKPQRILIVDDNIDSARCYAIMLRRLGHSVMIAHSGDEALRAAAAARPDTVLLDVRLPDMSGNEVARRLRTMDGSTNVQLIGVSGFSLDSSEQADFNHFLVKPIDLLVLQQLLAVQPNAEINERTSLKPK
jgi:CheY-like chemotaxis protein